MGIVKEILSFHFGTIVLLGLLKIVVRGPNRFFKRIQKIITKRQEKGKQTKCLSIPFKSCLNFYDRFLRYVNNDLIVQMCIWSHNLRKSGELAYFLILRHKQKSRKMTALVSMILTPIKVLIKSH
jgi:Plasma-membrane choline transporter.